MKKLLGIQALLLLSCSITFAQTPAQAPPPGKLMKLHITLQGNHKIILEGLEADTVSYQVTLRGPEAAVMLPHGTSFTIRDLDSRPVVGAIDWDHETTAFLGDFELLILERGEARTRLLVRDALVELMPASELDIELSLKVGENPTQREREQTVKAIRETQNAIRKRKSIKNLH